MRDVRLTADEADLVDTVIGVGLVTLRDQLVTDGLGPLNLGPVAAGWRESLAVIDGVRATLRAKEGAAIHLPVRRPAPSEGEVR